MNQAAHNVEQPVILVGLLDRLVEVPEPMPVSMFPQTWGWAVLGGVLFIVMASLVFVLVRHYRVNAYRRAALAELGQAGDDAVAVAGILRRTALLAFPRSEVCSASGRTWLEFLESTSKGLKFTSGPGEALAVAPYRPTGPTPGIGALAVRWVRTHRAREDQ